MSIKTLRTLCVIAKTGSFAKASKELHLSQAAISIQIKTLEQELGHCLFDRTARSPVLNKNGKKVLKRAQALLALYQTLNHGLSEDVDFAGEFTLGAVRTAQQLLAPIIANLLRAHPELQIRVVAGLTNELADKVESGALDAALIANLEKKQADHCRWSPYEKESYFIVAPKECTILDQQQLLQEKPFIRFDKHTHAGSVIDAELNRQGIIVNELMQLDSLEPALEMVRHNLGISIIPFRNQNLEQIKQDFQLIPFGLPAIHRQMGLYQRQNSHRQAVAELVLSQLKQDSFQTV